MACVMVKIQGGNEQEKSLPDRRYALYPLPLTFCTQGFSPSVRIRGLSAGGTDSARPFLLASSASVSRGPESVACSRRCWSETAVGQGQEEEGKDGKCRTKSARSRSWRCSLDMSFGERDIRWVMRRGKRVVHSSVRAVTCRRWARPRAESAPQHRRARGRCGPISKDELCVV